MSSIVGRLLLNSETAPLTNTAIRFTPVSYPRADSGVGVWSGANFEVTTDDNGEFEIDLPSALYAVTWRVRGIINRGFALVPTTAADLSDILVILIDNATYRIAYKATLEEFKAYTGTEVIIALGADANGDPGFFRRVETAPVPYDDVNSIQRTDGKLFVRFNPSTAAT